MHKPTLPKALEKQLRAFLVDLDALAERIKPQRRPQDRDAAECSPQELRVLAALGQQKSLTMSDIAGILKVTLGTATHTIDNLAAKGLVERKRVNPDRRVVEVGFSTRGRRINKFVLQKRMEAARALLGSLNGKDRGALFRLLRAVAEGE
ncbi:MAG: MarR family transcriptional regulator [Acidobacteriota bacterium]